MTTLARTPTPAPSPRADLDRRTTVLLITGAGRSGSTLLSRLLGGVEGFFAAGEVRYLWERGLVEGRLCACGRPLPSCPVWGEVLHRAYGGAATAAAREVLDLQHHTSRLRHLPRSLTGRSAQFEEHVRSYRRHLADVVHAARATTGAGVLVDASKLPSYGRILDGTPGIDLKVVHLVRDARAVAYSWTRRKPLHDGAAASHMQRLSPAKAATLWMIWNLTAEWLWSACPDRCVRVRYEDLMVDPAGQLRRILRLVDVPDHPLPVDPSGWTVLGAGHGVAGNADRMRHGPTVLRADREWERSMRATHRWQVTAITAPLLARYGYLGS